MFNIRFGPDKTKEDRNIQGQYETCVCCGCTTNVLRETSVHLRKHYVEGAGELCESCFQKVYGGSR